MNEGERDSLLKWLETSGQALELRVAQQFYRAGLETTESFRYKDVQTGQYREGDLLVHPRRREHDESSVLVVIECKHAGSKDKQWIGIRPSVARQRPLSLPTSWLSWCEGSREEQAAAQTVVVHERLVSDLAPCTRVVTAQATNNPAYDAARQALSATFGVAPEALTSDVMNEADGSYPVTGGALAVVVTTASLRVARLSKAGELLIDAVDEFEVICDAPSGVMRPVTIMNESAVPAFISRLKD